MDSKPIGLQAIKNIESLYKLFLGIFCPCCHNTFATTDAYLNHKAIQVKKEERRRLREEAEAEKRRVYHDIRQNQANSLGRYLKHNRYR